MTDLQERLRTEILQQLKKVTSGNAPNVYRLIQTESGYRNMEQRMIMLVATEGITPSACIPHIENELTL